MIGNKNGRFSPNRFEDASNENGKDSSKSPVPDKSRVLRNDPSKEEKNKSDRRSRDDKESNSSVKVEPKDSSRSKEKDKRRRGSHKTEPPSKIKKEIKSVDIETEFTSSG